ncbi:MAG: DUF4468 domain-containing protein [Janthinobacterium lividum]
MNQLFRVLLLCCLSGSAFGQLTATAPLPLDEATHRITYAATLPVAGASQAELLARAQAWASSHSPADKTPLTASQRTDVVVVTGTEEMIYPHLEVLVRQPLHYTATISWAEGSYTYRITDFVLEERSTATPTYVPAEAALLQPPPTKAAATTLYYLRTAFEEATAQLLGTLQTELAPLPAPATVGQ